MVHACLIAQSSACLRHCSNSLGSNTPGASVCAWLPSAAPPPPPRPPPLLLRSRKSATVLPSCVFERTASMAAGKLVAGTSARWSLGRPTPAPQTRQPGCGRERVGAAARRLAASRAQLGRGRSRCAEQTTSPVCLLAASVWRPPPPQGGLPCCYCCCCCCRRCCCCCCCCRCCCCPPAAAPLVAHRQT